MQKFGERPNPTSIKYFDNSQDYFEFVFGNQYDIHQVNGINEKLVAVNYSMLDAAVVENPSSNAAVAAFVTAHARLRLLKALEAVGSAGLYCDTVCLLCCLLSPVMLFQRTFAILFPITI